MSPVVDPARADQVEACKTYIEQTKLLVALASAFIVAPAAVVALDPSKLSALRPFVDTIIVAEAALVASVLAGYFVLGIVAGSQHAGTFDVYRPATRFSSLVQLGAYLLGLSAIVWTIVGLIRSSGTH
jgi:hypothetical protein